MLRDSSPSDLRLFLTVFGLLSVVYSLTAAWTQSYHIDAFTNAVTGWYVGNEGTLLADQHVDLATEEQRGNTGWFVMSPRGPVSQYPPGAALVAGVLYLITPGDMVEAEMWGNNRPDLAPVPVPIPPLWPATLSAVLVTAAACGALSLAFRRLGASTRQAAGAGIVSGVATTAWSVASNMSWTHGPAMLAIAVAMLAASCDRWLAAGLALGFGILVRPHIAVIAAVLGILVSVSRRSWRPVLLTGAGSTVGLLLLLAYNYWVWGELTVSGGYGSGFADRFVGASLQWFAQNVFGALFDLRHGLLVWAPFLVVLVWGAIASRSHIPDWTVAAALGGAIYLLLQLRANRFSGGDGHFAYRYPLEALTAAAPWLFVGYRSWISGRPFTNRMLRVLVIVAIAGQAVGAFLT